MESFRNLIRGWLGKVLLVLFLVPFALVGIEGYFAGGNTQGEAAKVGKQSVSAQEFEQVYRSQHQQLLEQVQNDASRVDEALLRKQVMQGLVSRALLLNQSNALGLQLSTAQIIELIHQEPSLQENGKFSEAKFVQLLQASGQTRDQLIDSMRRQMAVQQLASSINQTSIHPTRGLNQLLDIQGEKRHVHTASIPLQLDGIVVSDAQVAAEFKAKPQAYRLPAQVDLEYVVLSASQFAPQASVSDSELQAAYQQKINSSQGNAERHAQHILISVDAQTPEAAAKQQADALLARIQKGEDFATLAKQYSKDPGSAATGGDLGYMPKGTFVPEFEAALDQLKQGQVAAQAVKTQFGYHIIKLIDSRQPDVPSLESLKPELLAQLQKDKATTLFNEAVSALNEQAVEDDNLKNLAQTHQLPIQTAKGLSRAGQGGDLSNAEVLRAALSDESIHDRRISSGIALDPERMLWLRVTNAYPERAQTLAEASPVIRAQLQAQTALKQAQAKADQIIAAINAGQTLDAVSKQFGVAFADAGLIERAQGLPNKALQSAVYRLPAPTAGQLRATAVADLTQGVSLAALSEVQSTSSAEVPAEIRAQTGKMLTELLGQQELSDYVEYLRSHAKVTQNAKLLQVASDSAP